MLRAAALCFQLWQPLLSYGAHRFFRRVLAIVAIDNRSKSAIYVLLLPLLVLLS